MFDHTLKPQVLLITLIMTAFNLVLPGPLHCCCTSSLAVFTLKWNGDMVIYTSFFPAMTRQNLLCDWCRSPHGSLMSTFVTTHMQVGPIAFKGSGNCITAQFYHATLLCRLLSMCGYQSPKKRDKAGLFLIYCTNTGRPSISMYHHL